MGNPDIIETERLCITKIASVPIEAIHRFLAENRAAHGPWQPLRDDSYFEFESVRERHFRDSADLTQRCYVMLPRDSEEVIGVVNFTNLCGYPFQACYLGFAVAASHEGKGYMREALTVVLTRAFQDLELNRVMANFMPRNFRSARVLSSLRFEVEGFAKDYLCIAGRWEDHILTSLRRSNWIDTGF